MPALPSLPYIFCIYFFNTSYISLALSLSLSHLLSLSLSPSLSLSVSLSLPPSLSFRVYLPFSAAKATFRWSAGEGGRNEEVQRAEFVRRRWGWASKGTGVGVVVGIKGMRVIAKGNGGRGYHHRLEQQFILFLLPPIPAPSPSATASCRSPIQERLAPFLPLGPNSHSTNFSPFSHSRV
jgi:hypothetical protein